MQRKPIDEIHILWTSEGMSCDGDTVSITAASQPSIEDVVMGLIPGIPKVHLHNKVLAYETGDAFMEAFHKAARGELDPFILVVEGSIPNEKINGRPTFHYRLPDARVSDPGWSIAPDWNRWVAVERLAADRATLDMVCRTYLAFDGEDKSWADVVEQVVRS